jgi:TRAP-type C4-dicarboxylate transport system substrate-binding protein
MFYSSSVVKSVETFDAAATGILDCDMTGGGYQTGKNPAFQFAGDLMGGYQNPYQQMAWMLHGGGRDALNDLYNGYDMQFVGWWIPGPESLASTSPIRTAADFKDWKFRSPPGLATKVFAAMGASPIVMDFTEIFTALETGIIDGADAANLTNNVGLGRSTQITRVSTQCLPTTWPVTSQFGMQCRHIIRKSLKLRWRA